MPAVIGLVATVCANRVYNTSAEQEHEKTLHVQGLRTMVAARGGVVPGLYSPTVYWLLSWRFSLLQKHPQYVEPNRPIHGLTYAKAATRFLDASPSIEPSSIPVNQNSPISKDDFWLTIDIGSGVTAQL
jgi:hypothetical protein